MAIWFMPCKCSVKLPTGCIRFQHCNERTPNSYNSLLLSGCSSCQNDTRNALKSGQLPADLKILDEDTPMNTVKDKDDEMAVTNENEANVEVKDVEEQKNNEAESMDQE